MSILPVFLLGVIVLTVLLLCVLGMAIGVMAGRKPIKHCGSTIGPNGEVLECSLCGNRSRCPNQTSKNTPPPGSP